MDTPPGTNQLLDDKMFITISSVPNVEESPLSKQHQSVPTTGIHMFLQTY
jgi:hypothetical protein